MTVNIIKDMTINEILTKAGEAKTKEEKIKVLRTYNTMALRDILKIGFDENVKFVFPSGAPPYIPFEAEVPPSSLRKQNKRFKYFLSNFNTNLPMLKREKMFINVLESIDKEDAKLLIDAKDKKLNGRYKGITKKLVQDAFPGLL